MCPFFNRDFNLFHTSIFILGPQLNEFICGRHAGQSMLCTPLEYHIIWLGCSLQMTFCSVSTRSNLLEFTTVWVRSVITVKIHHGNTACWWGPYLEGLDWCKHIPRAQMKLDKYRAFFLLSGSHGQTQSWESPKWVLSVQVALCVARRWPEIWPAPANYVIHIIIIKVLSYLSKRRMLKMLKNTNASRNA